MRRGINVSMHSRNLAANLRASWRSLRRPRARIWTIKQGSSMEAPRKRLIKCRGVLLHLLETLVGDSDLAVSDTVPSADQPGPSGCSSCCLSDPFPCLLRSDFRVFEFIFLKLRTCTVWPRGVEAEDKRIQTKSSGIRAAGRMVRFRQILKIHSTLRNKITRDLIIIYFSKSYIPYKIFYLSFQHTLR